MQADMPPSVEAPQSPDMAIITVPYCSEPAPKLPREITFSIDGNDLQVSSITIDLDYDRVFQTGQTYKNFRFIGILANSSSSNCHMARLSVSPIHDDDQSRLILLKLANEHGTKQ